MAKSKSKITGRLALIILAFTISGFINLCLFVFQAKAAPGVILPKHNYPPAGDDACGVETMPEPDILTYPSTLPMVSCCQDRSHYNEAVVKTENDKPTFAYAVLFNFQPDGDNLNNHSYSYNSSIINPPPALLALSTTIKRE